MGLQRPPRTYNDTLSPRPVYPFLCDRVPRDLCR